MKNQTLRFERNIIVLVLSLLIMTVSFIIPETAANAATKKPSIAKEMAIPIGKMDSKVCWNINSYEIETAKKLTVLNKVKGATYAFTSSDTKVATISKDGGYLTGLKAGSATITCTQTLKNKKTTVGKCKVTVKKPVLKINKDTDNVFAIGSEGFNLLSFYNAMDPLYHIEYRNQNATYSLSSNSKDFTIKQVKCDASTAKDATDWDEFVNELKNYIGDRYFYGYQFTAKKAGTYTITVKETYNKKTVTLGSFKVIIKDACIASPDIDLLLGNNMNVYSLVDYKKADTDYYYSIENFDEANIENNPVVFYEDENDLILFGNKVGSAKVTVREGSEKGALIGTVTVTVAESPCQEIILDEKEFTAYVGDEYFNIYYDLDPWDTTDKVTITSDNPQVLKVEYDEDEMSWNYQPLETGTANVTIQCGNQSVICKVTVEEW
jgi:hypothetical protein